MKFLQLTFLTLFFTSVLSDYILQQIDEINGLITATEFNSNGDAYIAATRNNTNHQLYKLNSAKEILWAINIIDPIYKIIINSQNIAYLNFKKGDFTRYLSILREDTLVIERIDNVQKDSLFIDESDILIYDADYGITLLKPNSTAPILVKNLENFIFAYDENLVVDKKGNIYIGGYTFPEYASSVAVITKEAKQAETPYAIHYDFAYGNILDCVIVDENDDAWVFTGDTAISQLFKISNGNVTKIFTDELYETHRGKAVKDRIYVVSITLNSYTAPIYFLTLDGKVHRIPDLDEASTHPVYQTYIAADKDGNTYIGSYYAYEKGPVVLMKPDGEDTTWIDFPGIINIRNMVVDENGALWVVTEGQGIFTVKKGETAAVKVLSQYEVDTNLTGVIKINQKTNEVFILGNSGIYFVNNNSLV